MIYKKGKLTIDGYNLELLAKKFKTPVYCYSFNKLKENILNFKKNFNNSTSQKNIKIKRYKY